MMFPSTSVITFAIGITAVLMVANWFIWGLHNPRDLRHPSTITPLGWRDLLSLAAGRTIPSRTAPDGDDHGFKHVA